MQEPLRVALWLILLNLGWVAYFLVIRTLFPRRVAKTRSIAETMPGRAFAVGLVNVLFFGTIAFILVAILSNFEGQGAIQAILAIPTLFFIGILAIGLSFGLAGMVELVGERLAPAQTAFRRTLWGTLAISLAGSIPFIGWFLLLPYVELVGLGAFIMGLFWKEPTTEIKPPIT
jgi:hypothetical protein